MIAVVDNKFSDGSCLWHACVPFKVRSYQDERSYAIKYFVELHVDTLE